MVYTEGLEFWETNHNAKQMTNIRDLEFFS